MRDPRVRLEDIAEAISGIHETLEGVDFQRFEASWQMRRAVERGLEIISEASRGLSAEVRAAHPEVPWADIAGIGNVLRHEYHRVEALIIWNIRVEHLPVLGRAIESLMGEG